MINSNTNSQVNFLQLFDDLLVVIKKTKCNRNVFNNGESGMHAFMSVFTVASDPSKLVRL